MEATSKVCVKVYFDEDGFADVVRWAEKAGKRRKGLLLWLEKTNKRSEIVKRPNTKGLAKFMHLCFEEYRLTDGERTQKLAQLRADEERLRAERIKLGVEAR